MSKINLIFFYVRYLSPSIAIILFFIFYGMAANRYPGGSQASESESGFSLASNYYCNLLNHEAMNGELNLGRSLAVASFYIMCIGLFLFWRDIHKLRNLENSSIQFWQYSGIFSITALAGFFIKFHDLVTIVAGATAMIGLAGLIKMLYSEGLRMLFIIGLILALLILVNNLIYFTEQGISLLPIIQKFTFLVLFGWMLVINLTLIRRLRSR